MSAPVWGQSFPDLLADLWPLVIHVAVWVDAMNALEAAAEQRHIITRYAWVLGGLFHSDGRRQRAGGRD